MLNKSKAEMTACSCCSRAFRDLSSSGPSSFSFERASTLVGYLIPTDVLNALPATRAFNPFPSFLPPGQPTVLNPTTPDLKLARKLGTRRIGLIPLKVESGKGTRESAPSDQLPSGEGHRRKQRSHPNPAHKFRTTHRESHYQTSTVSSFKIG